MSFTGFALVVVIAWFAIGLGTSYLMARRGHDAFSWWLVGTAFGPLAVGYVLNRILLERGRTDRSHGAAGASSDGKVDVLVGIDGSPEAEAAAAAACALFGPRLGPWCWRASFPSTRRCGARPDGTRTWPWNWQPCGYLTSRSSGCSSTVAPPTSWLSTPPRTGSVCSPSGAGARGSPPRSLGAWHRGWPGRMAFRSSPSVPDPPPDRNGWPTTGVRISAWSRLAPRYTDSNPVNGGGEIDDA
jgi:hypothetical protein